MPKIEVSVKREIIKKFGNLGKKISIARKKDPRPVRQIAAAAGISSQYWYLIERNQTSTPIREEVIRNIEKVLNIDLEINFEE